MCLPNKCNKNLIFYIKTWAIRKTVYIHTYNVYFKQRVKHKVLQGIDEGVKPFKYNNNNKNILKYHLEDVKKNESKIPCEFTFSYLFAIPIFVKVL